MEISVTRLTAFHFRLVQTFNSSLQYEVAIPYQITASQVQFVLLSPGNLSLTNSGHVSDMRQTSKVTFVNILFMTAYGTFKFYQRAMYPGTHHHRWKYVQLEQCVQSLQ